METARLIKEYLIYPLVLGMILLTTLHWLDSNPRLIEESLLFGLKFASGFALIIAIVSISAIKYLRPIQDNKFKMHPNLIKTGFNFNKDRCVFETVVKGYDAEIFYSYEEDVILKSQFNIIVKFKMVSKEKLKTLRPGKRFGNTVLYYDFIHGFHEFKIIPPSSKDLIEDVENLIDYLENNNIKPN